LNSEIIKLLRDAANNFAQLAEAFEQEQKVTNSRMDCIEGVARETRQAVSDAAQLLLSKLS
jgi:hypothetical protein